MSSAVSPEFRVAATVFRSRGTQRPIRNGQFFRRVPHTLPAQHFETGDIGLTVGFGKSK